MEQTLYHVQLKGRSVGPYNRRTIVGMRMKNALSGADVLIDGEGARLTVADLMVKRPSFSPSRSGSYSLVRATYTAALLHRARGADIPSFRGEIEMRVQGDVLRMAGRLRQGFSWKDVRVKFPLKDIVHQRVRGSVVDLWLRAGAGDKLQHVALQLFTPESAQGFIEWLTDTTPHPGDEDAGSGLRIPKVLLVVGGGALLAVGFVLMAVLRHR